ncbi:efflux RND transporter periplasmic adaptor subunit [Vibrio hippocampi]|uniref:Efflux pump periplasmic linker BepF n=1 Tax=Vibrio hippocampi TaxID=654686 RepID=A0ABM8ZPF8_9VIBR|nr:efflux RND transporter periplasmic adaptor subunit [Vibrio hippocampi]CAH0530380.1 Efflux pump periplasmic linker BepF [Vibrio hippocampi]
MNTTYQSRIRNGLLVLLPLLSTIALSGCNKAQSEVTELVIKPVKVVQVPELTFAPVNSYLAQVDATDRAQLSFQVAGQISAVDVKMGETVQAGEVLATLDPTDYQVALDARQAEFNLAKSQFERAKRLFDQKLISADEFDRRETQYKAATASLHQAESDLGYTQIIAPFDGTVSMTYQKSFEVVTAKQPILNLISSQDLDVTFSIPVPVVKSMTLDQLNKQHFFVTLDSHRKQPIEAKFKEIALQPDLDTNSYQVSVTINKPTNINILAGMSGQVHIESESRSYNFALPQGAWINQQQAQALVWRFDAENSQVHQIEVTLNENGEVVAGLNSGDQIVVAGANNLVEGQRVKLWTREGGI